MTKKYIFEKGLMKINPAYKAEQEAQGNKSTVAKPDKALAIVSTPADIQEASEVQESATNLPMQVAESTTCSMEIMQDRDYLQRFEAPQGLEGGEIIDALGNIFSRYEIPIGLMNKLLALMNFELKFKIDDSGSMQQESDVLVSEATKIIKDKCLAKGKRLNDSLSRWEEAEDRLHIMMDILQYIPTQTINISFLNRADAIQLNHEGKTPAQFAEEAHQKIDNVFKCGPAGGTPIFDKLSQAFSASTAPTMHYLFTDGVPSDATPERVGELVKKRQHPEMNPLTFITCTNVDAEAEWMKQIEEIAPFTAELDDFNDEREEVLKDQGPYFPYSKGFWLLSQLVAAINPDDLDALDESYPLSKKTMDDLMGRRLTAEEYKAYFKHHPQARELKNLYEEFARGDLLAKEILRQQRQQPSVGGLFGLGRHRHGESAAAAPSAPLDSMQDPPPAYMPYMPYKR